MTTIAEISPPSALAAREVRKPSQFWPRLRAFFAAVSEVIDETARLKREASLKYPFVGY